MRSILEDNKDVNVIVFPSLALIDQFQRDYVDKPEFKHYWTDYKRICFCSLEEDEVKGYRQVKRFTCTTKPSKLRRYFREEGKKLVLTTYQSLKNFADFIKNRKQKIDRMYYDEAHHTTGSKLEKRCLKTKPSWNVSTKRSSIRPPRQPERY